MKFSTAFVALAAAVPALADVTIQVVNQHKDTNNLPVWYVYY